MLLGCTSAPASPDQVYYDQDGNQVSKAEFDRLAAENARGTPTPAVVQFCVDAQTVKEYCNIEEGNLVKTTNGACMHNWVNLSDYRNNLPITIMEVKPLSTIDTALQSVGISSQGFIKDATNVQLQFTINRAREISGEECESLNSVPLSGVGDEAVALPMAVESCTSDVNEDIRTGGLVIFVKKGDQYIKFTDLYGEANGGCSIEEAKSLIQEVILPGVQ